MTKYDLLIIGGGLAGTTLGLLADKAGLAIQLINRGSTEENLETASIVSSGIANPIIGGALNIHKNTAKQFSFARQFYQQAEQDTGDLFMQERQILRCLINQKQIDKYQKIIELPEYDPWIERAQALIPDALLTSDYLITKNAFSLDTVRYLSSAADFLQNKGQTYINQSFEPENLGIERDGFIYQDACYDKVVFCDGSAAASIETNPFAGFLEFRLAAGVILKLKISNLSADYIYNFGKFLLPLKEPGFFRLGATYFWEDFSNYDVAKETEALLGQFRQFFACDFEVIDHLAGIRPVLAGRNAAAGQHPNIAGIYFLNGLASHGVSQAPLLAQGLMELILQQDHTLLDILSANINRFYR